jgi:hypothetical protein
MLTYASASFMLRLASPRNHIQQETSWPKTRMT